MPGCAHQASIYRSASEVPKTLPLDMTVCKFMLKMFEAGVPTHGTFNSRTFVFALWITATLSAPVQSSLIAQGYATGNPLSMFCLCSHYRDSKSANKPSDQCRWQPVAIAPAKLPSVMCSSPCEFWQYFQVG